MPRLAIVGNAPLWRDRSSFIDASDRVIRFNDCKRYGGRAGTRTDILCVSNTGTPAWRFIRTGSIRAGAFLPGVREVWFPRDGGVHRERLRAEGIDFPETEFEDLWQEIVESNGLGGKRILRFTASFNREVFSGLQAEEPGRWRSLLRGRSLRAWIAPSTGMLAIEHVLRDPAYEGYEKCLLGFSFRGWRGHPWWAEKARVRRHAAEREDFRVLSPWDRTPAGSAGR